MKAFQKTVLGFAAMCLFSGALPALPVQTAVCAAESNVINGMTYEESNGEITITGFTADLPDELEIPAEIGGMPVTKIGAYAFSNSGLTAVAIPESVREIGNNGFTFSNRLKTVTLPENLGRVGSNVFSNTPWLTALKTENQMVIVQHVLLYAQYIYDQEHITVPDDVRVIGGGAFYCSSMKTVTISESVTDIGNDAFSSCENLESVVIPDQVTAIGEGAFSNCGKLQSIALPENLRTLGTMVFSSCSALQTIAIPAGVEEIPPRAFYSCYALTEVTLPETVKSIGEWAFFNCCNLQKCELPQNLKEIGENAFNCCAKLKTPVLPEHLTVVQERAFSFCDQITDITIPASVQQIGKEAFWKCEGLKKITVLNPDCLIYDSGRTISNQTNGGYAGVIAGYGGSEAQFYAESLGYTFESLGNAPELARGDLNGDGTIGADDAQQTLQAYVNLLADSSDGLSRRQRAAADVNRDQQTDSADAQLILQYYAAELSETAITWDMLLQNP